MGVTAGTGVEAKLNMRDPHPKPDSMSIEEATVSNMSMAKEMTH
jgi:hypothetical protein